MTVYVVLDREPGCDFIFEGVFKTRKQAQERMAEIIKDHSSVKETLYIEEYKLHDDIKFSVGQKVKYWYREYQKVVIKSLNIDANEIITDDDLKFDLNGLEVSYNKSPMNKFQLESDGE